MLSLRSYLIAMLLVLVAVPLALFWNWPQSRALENEFNVVRERHLLLARNLSVTLERYHRDLDAAFDFASRGLIAGGDMEHAEDLLRNLKFRSVCVLDAVDGRLIAELRGEAGCPGAYLRSRVADFAQAAKDGEAASSDVEKGPDDRPVFNLMRREGGKLVVATVNTSFFVELARSISFGVNGHAVIVDRHGHVLAHPVESWTTEIRDISKISAVAKMLAGEQGVETFYSPAFKDDMVAGYSGVASAGWGVMVPQPVAELRAAARSIQISSLAIFGFGLLMAATMAYLLADLVAKPVRKVTAAARRMAEGDGNVRIDIDSLNLPRELKELTQAFNTMAERVEGAHDAVNEARDKADVANSSKTAFLRTVTHELRSPLNAIIGFGNILASEQGDRLDNASRREFAKDIVVGARHLLSLANDLLDLARIEAGRYEVSEEIVGLDEIVQRVIRFVQPEASERSITLLLQSDNDAPAVRGDERALFQSVLNLTANAVRYGNPGGKVVLQIRRLEAGEVEISVVDDGPGIAACDLDRVLLPFERIARSNARMVQGSGLGLPIVKQLAELHGGHFRLESEVGNGTRAIFVLPAERVMRAKPRRQRTAA